MDDRSAFMLATDAVDQASAFAWGRQGTPLPLIRHTHSPILHQRIHLSESWDGMSPARVLNRPSSQPMFDTLPKSYSCLKFDGCG